MSLVRLNSSPTAYELRLARAFLTGKKADDKEISKSTSDAELMFEVLERITVVGRELTEKEVRALSNEFHIATLRIVRARRALVANGWTGESVFKQRKVETCKQYIRGIETCSRLKYVLARISN